MHPSDPVTVVTGGSGAIGSAIIRNFAAQGHRVFNLSLEKPAADLPASTVLVDLADRKSTADVLAEIASKTVVNNVINNAGMGYRTDIENLSFDRMQELFEVHNRASLQLIQAFVPGMKDHRAGRIVGLGSRMILGSRQRVVYGMVKAAMVGLSRNLAIDLAPHGITVNVVSPGPIETPLFRRVNPIGAPHSEKLVSAIPSGRIGTPEDVAHAVNFFVSPQSSFITGQNLYVCGGLSVGFAPV